MTPQELEDHKNLMVKLAGGLLKFVSKTNVSRDWHNTENKADVHGEVVGTLFNNFTNGEVRPGLIEDGIQEYVLKLRKVFTWDVDPETGTRTPGTIAFSLNLNLADLVALAAEGALRIMKEQPAATTTKKGPGWDFPPWDSLA